ncbi:hypothetical protein GGQ79_003609 [Ochrobactrum pecoris]|uniref:Uncharacterized protein n=1 Tax=Brucella pecoris TaxID=867683 RepID=A0AB34YW87_9HYPH|nr:hypothetical protein [Brucella pecoris]
MVLFKTESLEPLYPFVFTYVFIPKPVPTFGKIL